MEEWLTIKNLEKKNPNMGTRKITMLTSLNQNIAKKSISSYSKPGYTWKNKIKMHI